MHNIKGENTGAGTFDGLNLRHAWSENGWFSYDMKVDNTKKNYLLAKYFGPNQGRTFNIYVDDVLLKEETIEDKNNGKFYDEYYELPEAMVKGKDTINVKFAVRGDSWVGGVFDKLCIVHDYDSDTGVKSLLFDGADMDKTFDNNVKEYDLTVNDEKAVMSIKLNNENGLVYVNDILIDDAGEREIIKSEAGNKLCIKVVAEDYKTSSEFVFNIK